jgi:hypothetical protein
MKPVHALGTKCGLLYVDDKGPSPRDRTEKGFFSPAMVTAL